MTTEASLFCEKKNHLNIQNNEWWLENVPLSRIAKEIGTPCYVYSKAILEENWQAFEQAFCSYPHQIHYAVKACSNIAILNILARLGAGFDVVSGGELERVLEAGGDPQKIVFSGVGKTKAELIKALTIGIDRINIESEAELILLNQTALELNLTAPISIRINPDVDAKTHPYISTGSEKNKFGINLEEAFSLCCTIKTFSAVQLKGLAFHIGSQITCLEPFIEALTKTIDFIDRLSKENIIIQDLNIGGGLGTRYQNENLPTPLEYANAILKILKPIGLPLKLEPGRAIVANSSVLLTQVQFIKKQKNREKEKYFAIVDAAMNDLIRPALYDAWQDIRPLKVPNAHIKINPQISLQAKRPIPQYYDIVGPVCETADCLGKDRLLCIAPNDYLMICETGAYGFSMSSNYNSRPRAAEVLVHGNAFQVIRSRETIADLIRGERIWED